MTHSALPSAQSHDSTKLQLFFYRMFFAALMLSLSLFLLRGLGFVGTTWKIYYHLYLLAALSYTWFNLLLLCWGDIIRRTYPAYDGEKIAVIIPCYNEKKDLFKRALLSVLQAEGNKRAIVIDDGSKPAVRRYLEKMAQEYDITLHSFRRNRGKRAALTFAIQYLLQDEPYIVLMDSDTVMDKSALVRIVEPLKDRRIGAAGGDIRLLNEAENTLTRMIASYYWSALHIHRRAESALGMVSCCSGALSAYRVDLIREKMDAFFGQKLFGEYCTHSEDRHLTNLVLKSGHQVVFVPAAIAHTHTPSTYRAFLRQQQRWRRGFIQESLFTLSYAWRVRPLLFFQVLFWELMVPFLSLGMVLTFTIVVLTHPVLTLTSLLPSWLILTLVRNMPAVFTARKRLPGLLFFSVYSNFVSYWQGLYALFTLRNRSWLTR